MMNRRQWIGFVVFPAAMAAILAFLFFVAQVSIFRTRTGDEAVAELSGSADADVRLKAAGQLMKLVVEDGFDKAAAAKALRAALDTDPAPKVRMFAIKALAAAIGTEAAPDLAKRLTDPDHDVRRAAAFFLGTIPTSVSAPSLIAALADAYEPVRWNAAAALARNGRSEGIAILHSMLRAPSPRSTAKALNHILPTGEEITAEPSRPEHVSAILALDLVGDHTSISPLEAFIEAEIEPDLSDLARAAIRDIRVRTGTPVTAGS